MPGSVIATAIVGGVVRAPWGGRAQGSAVTAAGGSIVPLEAHAGLVGTLAGDLALQRHVGGQLDFDAGTAGLRGGALLYADVDVVGQIFAGLQRRRVALGGLDAQDVDAKGVAGKAQYVGGAARARPPPRSAARPTC